VSAAPFTYYEFFAGGGMARAGLGDGWKCLFANDFDKVKAETYRANWGGDHFREGDVHALTPADLPGQADLAWASSPCQDFSLAGLRKGLQAGTRSSAFWGFWSLMKGLNAEGRAPRVIVIENVVGLLTSHGGADFTALCQALADEGYRFGALEIDAARFLPQSRPRLFVVATRHCDPTAAPQLETHGKRVCEAYARLPKALKSHWSTSTIKARRALSPTLADVLEKDDEHYKVDWHSPAECDRLLSLLAPLHRERLTLAQRSGGAVGTLYRRTRIEGGVRIQRSEIRFDGVAGCLRTPGGGSSRQFLVEARPNRVRTRALTPREGARLMGLPDTYRLPARATAALHVIGDGVAVPVVRALAEQVLEPMLATRGLVAAE
jgi:DNA (cytosine-5)-methyltransferase 1